VKKQNAPSVVALALNPKLTMENLRQPAMLATPVMRAMTPEMAVTAAHAITGTLVVADAIVGAVVADKAKMVNQKLPTTMC
jgi:cytochrome bd-type quinol oxidase subunit 1